MQLLYDHIKRELICCHNCGVIGTPIISNVRLQGDK